MVGLVYAGLNLAMQWELLLLCGLVGGAVGLVTAVVDVWLVRTSLRRQPFLIILGVRTCIYLLVISAILLLAVSIYAFLQDGTLLSQVLNRETLVKWVQTGRFAYLVGYIFLVLLALQFITLVSRLLGPNVLLNYMMGRYHSPKEEERIFMFMDLRASTAIAERLGHYQWHLFLNDFFYDIGRPVRRHRGEIYQYVGDEVVISWPKEIGVKNLNCLQAFFAILAVMSERRTYYIDTYGYEPVFKAGYHVGKVIVGEIGDYKRDIVFHGDTVNTASRIQMECNHYNRRLLLSDTLLHLLDLGQEFSSEYITKIKLRGKEEILELYSVNPAQEIILPEEVLP